MDKQGPELLKVEELAERVRELEMHLESLQNRYAQVTGENEALRIPDELLADLAAAHDRMESVYHSADPWGAMEAIKAVLTALEGGGRQS